jgi:hypothetical protein
MTKPVPRRGVSIWIRIAVFLHVFAVFVWTLPRPPQKPMGSDYILVFNQKLKESAIKDYLIPTGFWQYWDMFSPNPSNLDNWCDAEVIYQNGEIRRYQYPRMKLLPVGQKYVMERFRKYYERAYQDANSYLWPHFAQRIALINFDDPKNPPVKVRLYRHWRFIRPPNEPQQQDYNSAMYFEYVVDQAKLRTDVS